MYIQATSGTASPGVRVCVPSVPPPPPTQRNPTTGLTAPLSPTRTHRKAGHIQVHDAALSETEALDLKHSPGILLNAEVMYHPAGGGGLQQAGEGPERSDDQHPPRTGRCCTLCHRHSVQGARADAQEVFRLFGPGGTALSFCRVPPVLCVPLWFVVRTGSLKKKQLRA